jgi:hypothetical protein
MKVLADEIAALRARLDNMEGSVAIAQTNANAALGIPPTAEPFRVDIGDPLERKRMFGAWDGNKVLGVVEATNFNAAIRSVIKRFGVPPDRLKDLRVEEVVERRGAWLERAR